MGPLEVAAIFIKSGLPSEEFGGRKGRRTPLAILGDGRAEKAFCQGDILVTVLSNRHKPFTTNALKILKKNTPIEKFGWVG